MAAQRLSGILSHVLPSPSGLDAILQQSPDDVVITFAARSPFCKAGRGGFKDTPLDGLVFKILEQVRIRSRIDPALVDDICLGNVRNAQAAYHVRAASLAAGFPNTSTVSSANRFCASGLTAIEHIANEIRSGTINIGIAVGAESLSEGNVRLNRPFVDEIMNASQDAADVMLPMGATSENVAKDFNISRQQQDEYAVESYSRAELAQKSGWFDDEIVPITVRSGGKEITIDHDDIRHGTKYETISKLKPSFPEYGDTTHAGNASQITDGTAAILLMKRSKALELGQRIIAKYVGASIAGLAPRIMGIGPTLAIPKLVAKYKISLDQDVDVIEINEAFSSMMVYCRDTLALDWTKLNPRGGAVALGHPFGATGVRQVVTGLSECRRRRGKILITSMCMGSGMGMAGLFVNEQ